MNQGDKTSQAAEMANAGTETTGVNARRSAMQVWRDVMGETPLAEMTLGHLRAVLSAIRDTPLMRELEDFEDYRTFELVSGDMMAEDEPLFAQRPVSGYTPQNLAGLLWQFDYHRITHLAGCGRCRARRQKGTSIFKACTSATIGYGRDVFDGACTECWIRGQADECSRSEQYSLWNGRSGSPVIVEYG